MKYCPQCANRYPNDLAFCTVDGSPLSDTDREAETLKIGASHLGSPPSNITHIIKTEVMEIGDYIDFATPQFTIRITVKDLVEDKFPDFVNGLTSELLGVYIAISLKEASPAIFHRGSCTKVIKWNEYLLPVADSEHDESRSIFSFHITEDKAMVFRLFVKHINTHSRKVELSLGYFRYKKD
jgi:hypothetical protein